MRLQILRLFALGLVFLSFWIIELPRSSISLPAQGVLVATSGLVLAGSATGLWYWRVPFQRRAFVTAAFLMVAGPAQNLIMEHFNEHATFSLLGAWAYVFVGV